MMDETPNDQAVSIISNVAIFFNVNKSEDAQCSHQRTKQKVLIDAAMLRTERTFGEEYVSLALAAP